MTVSPAPSVEPLPLEGDILQQRAWRMPDLVVYRHGDDEWRVAPLDEDLPLVRLNRMGAALLGAMDGRLTIAALLDQFGTWLCGPNKETGRWFLERWSLPRYSLCYFGTDPPTGHNVHAKWDLLLQKVRDQWHENAPVEHEGHLTQFHHRGIQSHHGHFEIVETTVSHLLREPCDALRGLSYGRAIAQTIRRHGWWNPKPQRIVEVGAGLGYLSREMAQELSPLERRGVDYIFLDLTRPFLQSQLELAGQAGWNARALHANAEHLPFADASVDLVIDNENLADMTPVTLSREELETSRGRTPDHQRSLDRIRTFRLTPDTPYPQEAIFNEGAMRFLTELWRVLTPGGHALLIEFGIDTGWPDPVRLPGHTEYEVQFTHLRHAARWLGFREHYGALPQFLPIQRDAQVLCTGATYAIRRLREAEGHAFAVRAYTESELRRALGTTLSRLTGLHYHHILDPAWFSLWDFKVLLLEKPGGAPRPAYREAQGFRWYSQR